MIAAISLVVVSAVGSPPSGIDDEALRHAVDEVFASGDFGHETTEMMWRVIPDPEVEPAKQGESRRRSGLGQLFGTILLYVIGSAGLLAILWLAIAMAGARRQERREELARRRAPPETLFGLDLRAESMPQDIAAAALATWQAGDPLRALSLLYRGALRLLTVGRGLEIPASATEGECIRLVEQVVGGALGDHFAGLTHAWIDAAYGKRPPSDESFALILASWRPYLQPGERR